SWAPVFSHDGSKLLFVSDASNLVPGDTNGYTDVFVVTLGPPAYNGFGLTGDFNGDGKFDILWQNDGGQAGIWLMNGTTLVSATNVGPNPGPAWHVKGTGDFNGDGKSDILWQNADGSAGVWLMDGTNLVLGTNVGSNPGPAWHAMGAGD